MKKVYWNDYLIIVWCNILSEDKEDDLLDKYLFETSILNYLILFKQLPLKGTHIENSNCDACKITQINFCGNSKTIFFNITINGQ